MASTTETEHKTDDAHHGHGDPSDPHYTEHHVVSWQILTAVLVVLYCLTALTIGVAFVHLGESLNVFMALLIATVKGTLVALIFMHLKWDKPINSIVLGFSILLLALFLFMSILDTGQYQSTIIPDYADKKMEALRAALPPETGHEGTSEGEGEHAVEATHPEDAQELQTWAAKIFRSPNAKGEKVSSLQGVKVWPSKDYEVTDAKVALGHKLFFDPRLSVAGDISCNTCHDLAKGGVDPRGTPTSAGHQGQMGTRNSPTVFNAAIHTIEFWDGRAKDVEEQATMPMTNPVEMAMADHDAIVAKLQGIPGYVEEFKAAFGGDDSLTITHVAQAIGAFERELLTPAKFDDFLAGNLDALSTEEYAGLRTFKETNCIMCHSGLGIGGTMKQIFGLQGGYGGHADEGQMFKTPGLRNVTLTAPYYHDGSESDLGKVVRDMAKYQLGQDLTENQVSEILTFLKSLEGQAPAELIATPELPQ